MNPFDIAVLLATLVLAILGLRAGLLRSVADIVGFLIAAPLAVALAPRLTAAAGGVAPSGNNGWAFFGILVVGGILFAQLLRFTIADLVGHDISLLDRFAGLVLGVVRALLVAVTVVLIFDKIIPSGREPPFLQGSKTRPILSLMAQRGLRSLPPDVTAYIDRMKRQRGL
jgi:membrane protein required for colicin V production